jgi:cellulose biosynthesis protein BcsQ
METIAFWNNKGGTGKTSLLFQTVCRFAQTHTDKRILVIDLCPQANLSELMLGGQEHSGSANLLSVHGRSPRCSIGGYFDARLPSPFSATGFSSIDYIMNPSSFNTQIPSNIDLVCGDPLLELQAIAMNTLANANLPGVNTWIAVIDWLKDFLAPINDKYDFVYIDTNPSFSMYTQIGLATAEKIVLPVMADDSSRRAVQNAFSLIYGIRLPSPVYAKYTFSTLMLAAGRALPKVHLVIKNRITQYMGDASAYHAVLTGIDADLKASVLAHPSYFTFSDAVQGVISVRDFQTAGVVAFARGCPFSLMPVGKLSISGHRVQVKRDYRDNALAAINAVAKAM